MKKKKLYKVYLEPSDLMLPYEVFYIATNKLKTVEKTVKEKYPEYYIERVLLAGKVYA